MNCNSTSSRVLIGFLLIALVVGFPISATADENPQLLFVLDISGSMGDRVGGVVKLEAAKNSVYAIAPGLSSKGIDLGLMHFSGCGGVSYPLPPGKNNSARISQIVNNLNPGGGTPLAGALRQAGQRLSAGSGEKRIILLSDGKETCGGDPVAAVSRFASDKLKVHVVGFDVGSSAANQLRKIASAGGGLYNQARNAQQLKDAFEKMAEDLEENLLEKMRSCVELGGGNKTSYLKSPNDNEQSTSSSSFRSLTKKASTLSTTLSNKLTGFLSVAPAYGQGGLPEWVQNPGSQYPEDQYLTAVGSGSALPGAKNKAKQSLLEIFSQEIQSSKTMREVTKEVSTDAGKEFSQKLDLQTDISIKSTGELIGARIEKSKSVFHNGRTKYYALAVLDMNQAVSSYEDELEQARTKLDRVYSAVQRADDPLNKLRYLTKARRHAANALKYQGYLTVLNNLGGSSTTSSRDSSGSNFESRAQNFREDMDSSESASNESASRNQTGSSSGSLAATPAQIDRELESVFQSISISLDEVQLSNICEGTRFDDQMKRTISEQFTKIGFRTESGTDGLVVIDGHLSANYTTRGRKSDEGIRWNLTLNMKNTKTGRTFATINKKRVTTGLDKANVASRTRFEITEWLEDNMNETITEKLLST